MRGRNGNLARSMRLSGLCAGFLAGLLLSAAPAAAGSLTVTLAGAGGGTVKSEPAGIDCTNAGNPAGPGTGECSKDFGTTAETPLKLVATPGNSNYAFAGWSGTGGGTCASGLTNPCQFTLGFIQNANVTATFIPKPPLAIVTTGAASAGQADYLRTLEGTVNPNGSIVLDCRFEYGPTPAYGESVPCVPKASELGVGDSPIAVSAETEPLDPGATYHFRLAASNLGGGAVGASLTFATGLAGPDPCPNAARRAEQGIVALLLPDCMALEMVSPPQKSGQPAKEPSVSADGERVVFRSVAPLGNTPGVLSAGGDAYVASRGVTGWETAPTVPPAEFPRGLDAAAPKSFTRDFSSWLQLAATSSQSDAGIVRGFRGGLNGIFEPLSSLLVPPAEGSPLSTDSMRFEAASADHSHFYFRPGGSVLAYSLGDPAPAGSAADRNVYLAGLDPSGEPSLQLLTRDQVGPDAGKVWGGRCGARIGGIKTVDIVTRNQGAVSTDGSRTYFSTRPGQPAEGFCTDKSKLRILVRTEVEESGETKADIEELIASECTRIAPQTACSTANGDDRFQGASVDGSKVYFVTTRQLADSDTDATSDLYLHDSEQLVGQRLTQVSAGDSSDATPGAGANVQGNVTALSTDGSHVYFVATDVLTTDANPVGVTASAGQPNLYLWNAVTGVTSFVGTLASGDSAGLWGDQGGFRNQAYPVPATGQDEGEEVGGDGHVLLLQSKAPLTAQDVDGERLDVFRYDSAADTLECVSCKSGGPDAEPFAVASRLGFDTAGADFAEWRRWASEDGDTVVFTSAQPLLPGDGNGVSDFFIWRDGDLYRLPGRAFFPPTQPLVPALSHDGDEVAFQTSTALLPFDGDNAPDVYVARVDGGFPNPVAEEPCQIDEDLVGVPCQARGEAPVAPVPVSAAQPPGNVAPPPKCRKGFVRKGAKCAKKPVRKCRKGFVRKGAKCAKKPRKNSGRSHAKQGRTGKTRQADGDRRAAK